MSKVKVSHILVESEYQAQDLLKLLERGKDFAELAKKYSRCSSASQGGNLGEIALSRLDEDFADATLALKVGEITKKPIRTKFGYHLIRRD